MNRRAYGGRAITIQGNRLNIHVARIKYCCFTCGADLKIVGHGLKCSDDRFHYGMLLKSMLTKLSESERLMRMNELFPNKTGKMRSIDLPGGAQVMTVKEVFTKSETKFQSKEKEINCYFSFEEVPLRVKITVTNGYELLDAWGGPENDNWVGRQALVSPLREKGRNVVRVNPDTKGAKPAFDISKMSKLQWVDHCKSTLDVWTKPFNKVQFSSFLAYVLGQAGLVNGKFEPQAAYSVMVEIGVPLHNFLVSLGVDVNYDFGLAWLQTTWDEKQRAYTPDTADEIKQDIFKAQLDYSELEAFYEQVMKNIPWYQNHGSVEFAMHDLKIDWKRGGNVEIVMERLSKYALEQDLPKMSDSDKKIYTPEKFITDVNQRLKEKDLPEYEELSHLAQVIGEGKWPRPEAEQDWIEAGKIAVQHKAEEPFLLSIIENIRGFNTKKEVKAAISKLGRRITPNDDDVESLAADLSDYALENFFKEGK